MITGTTSGAGRGASLTLNAEDLLRLTNFSIVARADQAARRADAGSISIRAGSIELLGPAEVLTVAQNKSSSGGALTVRADRSLTIDGSRIAADTLGKRTRW